MEREREMGRERRWGGRGCERWGGDGEREEMGREGV